MGRIVVLVSAWIACGLAAIAPAHAVAANRLYWANGAEHGKSNARFSRCKSPKTYKHLKPGRYIFEVPV